MYRYIKETCPVFNDISGHLWEINFNSKSFHDIWFMFISILNQLIATGIIIYDTVKNEN